MQIFRLPHHRVGWTGLALAGCLVACQSSDQPVTADLAACQGDSTPIAWIQGAADQSTLLGQRLTVRGRITLRDEGGYYLEEPDSDASDDTSNALYIAHQPDPPWAMGNWLQAQGQVTELHDGNDTLTALTDLSDVVLCSSSDPLPVTAVTLPLSEQQKEALEGMNLRLQQELLVTDVYRLSAGQVRFSAGRILPAPTEVARPGADARKQGADNRAASLDMVVNPEVAEDWSVGATLIEVGGVLAHDGRGPQLRPLQQTYSAIEQPIYPVPSVEPEDIRVLSLNLHNYFNGDGDGGGFPTPRGAETPGQFLHQRKSLVAALERINPHLVAVMELENDGFGPASAAADLARDLTAATGQAWQAVMPVDAERIGSDAITVGLFYRPDSLQPHGPPELLSAAPFDLLNRVPLAQAFMAGSSGQPFLVVVNHFKSKGSCPDQGRDQDQRDGQGCWNPARVRAAEAMSQWAQSLARRLTGGRALIVGDMNAYRMEDPIRAIINNGFEDLTASSGFRPRFSYIYRGEAGTLDHAFASRELHRSVHRANILNINSIYPPGMTQQRPWLGFSDHDPVVVDLRLRQAATPD